MPQRFADDDHALGAQLREQYEHQGQPYYSTARLWDDGVIDPLDTRRVLGLALGACANAPLPERAASITSGCGWPCTRVRCTTTSTGSTG